ncbi:MAG: hypothetical protein K8Q91_03480 [Candidatus Vogelbacteria bacterium]|nr:hypothetical protein [Candidatus Vogelbacteria bacterium]
MTEDNLQTKIQAAKQALTGNKNLGSNNLFATELVSRRKSTLSLVDADRQTLKTNPTLTPEEIAKRREQAKRAMESFEHKQRRETREKRELESRALAQKIEEMKKARLDLERKKSSEEFKESAKMEEDKRKLSEGYQKKVAEARAEVEAITKSQTQKVNTYHTLQTDINDQVTSGGLTLTKIALEDEARHRLETLPREPVGVSRGKLILIGSLGFIILGIGFLTISFVITRPGVSQVQPVVINSIVFAEEHQEVVTDNQTPNQIQDLIKTNLKKSYSASKVIDLYPTKTITTDKTIIKKILSGPEILTFFQIAIPINFTHFLLDPFMMGVVSDPTATSSAPFFIFKTRSFENTLDSMLREENIIVANIFGPLTENKNSIQIGNFTDKIINNIDTRILSDTDNNSLAIYGFVDRSTLIMTTTEAAFTKLLTAYQTPKPTVN